MTCPGCLGTRWTQYNVCKPCNALAVCTCGVCLGMGEISTIVPRKQSHRWRAQEKLSAILMIDAALHPKCKEMNDA